jgi:hypothetical protein
MRGRTGVGAGAGARTAVGVGAASKESFFKKVCFPNRFC